MYVKSLVWLPLLKTLIGSPCKIDFVNKNNAISGLPLSVAFGRERLVIGFDINEARVKELRNFIDVTNECTTEEIKKAKNLEFTSNLENLADCNCYIVTVPTPINKLNKPDLDPLIAASTSVASILKCGDIVI